MRTQTELHLFLSEVTKKNKRAIEHNQENIEKASQAIETATADILKAEETIDVEKYNDAKNALFTARHTKELYTKQKEKLSETPLITREEYNSLLNEITQSTDEVHAELYDRACSLIAELRNLSDESSKVSSKANELMRTLQYEIYKDADVLVGANGNKVTQEKEYSNSKTVHSFYNFKVKGTPIALEAGEVPEVRKSRSWDSL